jgi:hypothetical protein
MKSLVTALALALVLCAAAGAAFGFQVDWTDPFGQSTYTILGPDSAPVGDSLTIVIRAVDPFYPEDLVAAPWRYLVDGVQQDGGFGIWLTGGVWERTYAHVFPSPGSHTFTFRAQDTGEGGGGHNYVWFEISGTTVVFDPLGACCFVDCSCHLLTAAECVAQNGVFLGEGTTCDPNPCDCPPPMGACCFQDCTCQVLTQENCYASGGYWLGPSVFCEPSPCECPPGACCFPDGSCAYMNQIQCAASGGQFYGFGVPCDPNPCATPSEPSTWGRIKAKFRS